MSQPLTIRFASDVEGAKRGVADLAGSVAGNMTKMIGSLRSGGAAMDSSLAGAVARVGALQIALAGAALTGGVLFAKAVSDANEQLDRYIELGQKAEKVGVGVEFLQKFRNAAGDAKDAVDLLDKALANAGKEATEQFEKVSATRKLLGELFSSGFTGDFQSQGLRQFDQSKDAEGRIKATLVAMRELQDLGLQLAAVKLGETMFGADFAERVRQGRIDIEAMIASLEQARGNDIVTQEEVQRASDLRDRISAAGQAISDAIGVSFSLASAGNTILGVWASILETVLKAINAMKSFTAGSEEVRARALSYQDQVARNRAAAQDMALGNAGGRAALEAEQAAQSRQRRAGFRQSENAFAETGDGNWRLTNAPLPVRPPTNIAELRANLDKKKPAGGGSGGSEGLDRIESFINALERSRDVLKAELDNLGKSNVEREKAIELAKAEAAARAAQRDLTDAERSRILALAEAQGQLKDRILDVKQAQQQVAESTRFAGEQMADAFGAILIDGRKAGDVLKDLEKSLAKMVLQASFTGQGPLAAMFGFAPKASEGSNAVGGLFGLFKGLFGGGFNVNGAAGSPFSYGAGGYTGMGPFRAGGGDVRAGRAYTVGELGREIFVPDRDGRVYPVGKGQASSGGVTYSPTYIMDNRGADQAAIARIERGLAERDRRFGPNVLAVQRQASLRGTL